MKINTAFAKAVEINDDTVIEFPNGLAGFENLNRFVLLHEEGGASQVHYLQAVDDADVSFTVVPPENLSTAYEIELGKAESTSLKLAGIDPAEVVVLVILSRDDEDEITALLSSPLIINARHRLGLQKRLTQMHKTTLISGR